MEKRIEFIDLAKGICMLTVILLHTYGDTSGTIVKISNYFMLPLYFMLSGMFFKTSNGPLVFLKNKTNKLIVPLICSYIFVVLPIAYILQKINGGDSSFQFLINSGRLNLGVNGVLWFMVSLLVVHLYFYFVLTLCRNNINWIIFCSCICGLVGYILNLYNLYLPVWMDSSLTVMPFFLIGYTIKKYSNFLYGNFSTSNVWMFVGALLVLLIVFFINSFRQREIIVYADNIFNIDILSLYVGGITGTCCVLMVAKFFTRLPVLSYIGRYSIIVLLTHLIYLFILRNILYHFGVDQSSDIVNCGVFIIIVILSLPTIKFCVKYLPYCFAQKDLWK